MARAPSSEYLILDIESVPDVERWHMPEPPPGQSSPFPPTWAHRIVVIGYAWLDHDYGLKHVGVIRPADEATTADEREAGLLAEFSRLVGKARPVIVTYNGRGFDLPVIALRALCHGIPIGWYYRDRTVRSRHSEEGHLDLCDWLADHGAARSGSLDAVTRLIGLPGKIGIDGSQVEGLYRAGDLAAIERYCLGDVVQTAFLLLRFRLLQGRLSRETYRDVAAALYEALERDGQVAEVLAAVNRDALLLTGSPD